jgi:hypothetical protein
MIEIDLEGRLGNWLFQYAIGRSVALRQGTDLVLNLSGLPPHIDAMPLLSFFRLETSYSRASVAERRQLEEAGLRERLPEQREYEWGADPRIAGLVGSNRLVGYFQSASYWQDVEPALRAELSPRSLPTYGPFHQVLAAIESSANAVSVHVRRGDYLNLALHRVCTAGYYVSAVDLMRAAVDRPRFFVFSDDLEWSRTQLRGDDFDFVDMGQHPLDAPIEMYLMSRCMHHIVSNSTFSWWGAWMNGRAGSIVCVPDRWFNDPAMDRLAMRNTVPAQWRRIPAGPPEVALL